MDGPMRLPLARSEGLVTEELGNELLVYDLKSDNAHCLSATAGQVWQASDGKTATATIAAQLGLETDEVTRAVNELNDCELLVAPTLDGLALTRRDLSFKVAKVGAAAATLPLILSIAAPAAAQTQSQIAACAALSGASGSCGTCNQGGTPSICCCCHLGPGNKFCAAGDAHCESIKPTGKASKYPECTEQLGDAELP